MKKIKNPLKNFPVKPMMVFSVPQGSTSIISLIRISILVIFLQSCSSSKKTVLLPVKPVLDVAAIPDSLQRKQASGIDYFASGEIPSPWTLEMDIDKGYYFTAGSGISMKVPPVKPSADAGKSFNTYTAETSEGIMSIVVFESFCDPTSKNRKVTVSVNNTVYSGCGKFLYNPLLNGKWNLEKAHNVLLDVKDFSSGLPYLDFDPEKETVKGYDGCGRFTSMIKLYGSRINFSQMVKPNSSCKNPSVQKIFNEKLNMQSTDYFFKEGKLFLYLIDDTQLVFVKAQ